MRHATAILIIAFSTIAAGCYCRYSDLARPDGQAGQRISVIDGVFIIDHGRYHFVNDLVTYAIVFNKVPSDYTNPTPAHIALLKSKQSVIDEALGAGCSGVCLNVPSESEALGNFWAYWSAADWSRYHHNLASYRETVTLLSGHADIDGRRFSDPTLTDPAAATE